MARDDTADKHDCRLTARRKLRERDTLIGSSPRAIKRQGVQLKPRATGASGRTVTFADGSELAVDAVIWASGFGVDHSWIHPPVAEDDGHARHQRGVSDTPGLYFLGLQWQHTRGSALLGWVKDDAEYISGQIHSRETSAAPEVLLSTRVARVAAP